MKSLSGTVPKSRSENKLFGGEGESSRSSNTFPSANNKYTSDQIIRFPVFNKKKMKLPPAAFTKAHCDISCDSLCHTMISQWRLAGGYWASSALTKCFVAKPSQALMYFMASWALRHHGGAPELCSGQHKGC